MSTPLTSPVALGRGFTLVELLIVLVLASGLVAFVGKAFAQLVGVAETAAQHVELTERLAHFLRLTSDLAVASTLPGTTEVTDLCELPSTRTTVGLMVINGLMPTCISLPGRRPQTPVLVIDTLTACETDCVNVDFPAYVWLQPGCHPLFQISEPQLRWVHDMAELESCSALTQISYWQRQLIYLRAYGLQSGDGEGALMLKKLNSQGLYGRAEMLVAKVLGWQFSPRPYQLSVVMHAKGGPPLPKAVVLERLPVAMQAWAQSLLPPTVSYLVEGAHVRLTSRGPLASDVGMPESGS